MYLYTMPDLSEGWLMLAIGMGVTFTVLAILFLVFSQLKNLVTLFDGTHKKTKTVDVTSQSKSKNPELTADVNAAISMALYYYLNDQHDHESEVVTIKAQQRKYSPWSSKIYGLNNIIK
ncbi:MAG: OadG family protein [Bacteroidales bacterium]|nr:OadG family protein [Bacteroidales bacterium]